MSRTRWRMLCRVLTILRWRTCCGRTSLWIRHIREACRSTMLSRLRESRRPQSWLALRPLTTQKNSITKHINRVIKEAKNCTTWRWRRHRLLGSNLATKWETIRCLLRLKIWMSGMICIQHTNKQTPPWTKTHSWHNCNSASIATRDRYGIGQLQKTRRIFNSWISEKLRKLRKLMIWISKEVWVLDRGQVYRIGERIAKFRILSRMFSARFILEHTLMTQGWIRYRRISIGNMYPGLMKDWKVK